MRKSFSLLATVIALALLAGCSGKSTVEPVADAGPPVLPPKTPKPLDVSYIPSDAVFALVIDPYQLINSPNLESLAGKQLAPEIYGDSGIDPEKVEQMMLVGGPGQKLTEFFYGTILRFKQPTDQEQLLTSLSPEWEEKTEGDRKYFRSLAKDGGCVYLADDRTVVMAEEATLKKMLAVAKDADSPLLGVLRKSDDAAALLSVLAVEPIRGKISAFMLFSPLPGPFNEPPLDALKEMPKKLSLAVARMEVTPKLSMQVDLRGKDAEAAADMDKMIATALDGTRDMLKEDVDKARESGGNAQRSAGAGFLNLMFTRFYDGLKRRVENDQVVLNLEGDALQGQFDFFGPQFLNPLRNSWRDARQRQSRDNLKQLAAAFDAYLGAKGSYPAPAIYGADGQPLLSWRVQLLPMLGQQALYDQFHLDEPWDSAHNKKLLSRIPAAYRNPGRAADGKTKYVLPTGEGTLFAGKEGPKSDQVTDDKSRTIMLVEVDDEHPVEWTRPADLPFKVAEPSIALGTIRKPFFTVLFVDGSTATLELFKHQASLVGLMSPAGGEEVPKEF